MNKKTIGIILIILLIIITIIIIINVNKGRNVEVTESGNIIDSEKLIEFEDFDIDVQEQNDKLLKIFPDGRQSSIMSIEDIYTKIQKGECRCNCTVSQTRIIWYFI